MHQPACSDFPEWVLLDTIAHAGRCSNATTAGTVTSDGGHIEVSFAVADPPALTRCLVHCSELTADDFLDETPRVTGADGAFLLIRVIFPRRSGRSWSSDVFVYRAGPGYPSLRLLPRPYPVGFLSNSVGVLSCADHFLVVVPELRFDADRRMMRYDLHVFSGKTMSWSTKPARSACYPDEFYPTKVFSVEGGSLAWVDLRNGILLCNSLTEEPELRVIHLPPALPTNKRNFRACGFDDELPPLDSVRDVTYRDGWFRLVEMEFPDFDDDADDDGAELNFRWTATTFKTMIGSEEWEQEPLCAVDSADLSPADSCFPCLFPEIWDCKENKLLNRVMSSDPTLDMYDDDALYMIAKTDADDRNRWVSAINTKSKELDEVSPFSAQSVYFDRTHMQCSFSKHLTKS